MHFAVRLGITLAASAATALGLRAVTSEPPAPVVVQTPIQEPEGSRSSLFSDEPQPVEVDPLTVVSRMKLGDVWHIRLSDGRRLRTDYPNHDGIQEITRRSVFIDGEEIPLKSR